MIISILDGDHLTLLNLSACLKNLIELGRTSLSICFSSWLSGFSLSHVRARDLLLGHKADLADQLNLTEIADQ